MIKEEQIKFPIDFVVTWVDGSDPTWREKKTQFTKAIKDSNQNQINRYRDYGLLRNWFDRVRKYAPWVRQIFLITDEQAPGWAYDDQRIVVVNHSDFIPKKYLPTFNSNAIEMNAWRIAELSEHFVLFNDDMYITKPVFKKDFFDSIGRPVLTGSLNPVVPRDNFAKIIFNNMVIVNTRFPKNEYFKRNWKKIFSPKYGLKLNLRSLLSLPFSNWLGFYEDHLAYPHLKSQFIELNSQYPEIFEVTSAHRFREGDDYSQWLIKNMNLASGNFKPRDRKFGKVLNLSRLDQLKKLKKMIEKYQMVVINDDFTSDPIIPKLQDILSLKRKE